MEPATFHFGDWLRDRVMEMGMRLNAFAELTEANPNVLYYTVNQRAVELAPGDAERLNHELGLPDETVSTAMRRAISEIEEAFVRAASEGWPRYDWPRKVRRRTRSIWEPRTYEFFDPPPLNTVPETADTPDFCSTVMC